MKLGVQAGALRPAADTVVMLIFLLTFGENSAPGECVIRGCHVGLPGLLPLILSIGTCLGFARIEIMIAVLVR